MKTAKIVIGANFGDEGKGLMTDYFARKAIEDKQSCLVVCHNGGSQKGHTVVAPSGLRHVFHHFGSGNMAEADTYLSEDFIINPVIFNKELQELKRKECVTKTYVNKNAKVTTPFEMIINQMAEEVRGNLKHGSCGLGIYETILRNQKMPITISDFASCTDNEIRNILNDIFSNYIPDRLRLLGIDIPLKWVNIFTKKDVLIENYIRDISFMLNSVILTTNSILDSYDYVVFEGAQGLLLDQDNTSYMPHLTPSNTGIKNPMKIIGNRVCNIEVCYVTRTYMTRHGAGRFDTECNKGEINNSIIDLTNVANPFQDSIRYGFIDGNIKNRITSDYIEYLDKNNVSIAITHINEFNKDISNLKNMFAGYKIYESYGMTHKNIK